MRQPAGLSGEVVLSPGGARRATVTAAARAQLPAVRAPAPHAEQLVEPRALGLPSLPRARGAVVGKLLPLLAASTRPSRRRPSRGVRGTDAPGFP